MRLSLSNIAVMSLALAASLSTAYWIHHFDGQGAAQAEPLAVAAPIETAPAAGRPAQVLKAADGHFWAEARIDGRAVRVLIDTGASVVALTREDALRLGLRPTPADFTARVETASGPAQAAPVTLRSVSVAGAEVRQVQALIVDAGLPYSLLGMSYMGRLSRFEASPTSLTLRP
jgi:aspartyl protease family protein